MWLVATMDSVQYIFLSSEEGLLDGTNLDQELASLLLKGEIMNILGFLGLFFLSVNQP